MSASGQNIKELKKHKDKPLVMAYIGDDNPHRGDTKGTTGIAKLVTQMIGGRYVYVDWDMLENEFPHVYTNDADDEKNQSDAEARLVELCDIIGPPDILLGSRSWLVSDLFDENHKIAIIDGSLNEGISHRRTRTNYGGIVTHHLSKELLEGQARALTQSYPEIRGDLVAVMMGGKLYSGERTAAKKLIKIASHYDDITLFICPSGRTDYSYPKLIHALAEELSLEQSKMEAVDDDICELTYFSRGGITVIGTDYNHAINGDNPYLGLLGKADHIVQIGKSGSIMSEALFTGKNIFTFAAHDRGDFKNLIKEGYLQPLAKLKDGPFPTRHMLSLDVSYEVASDIAKEFKKKAYGQITNLPVPIDIYESAQKKLAALAP